MVNGSIGENDFAGSCQYGGLNDGTLMGNTGTHMLANCKNLDGGSVQNNYDLSMLIYHFLLPLYLVGPTIPKSINFLFDFLISILLLLYTLTFLLFQSTFLHLVLNHCALT